MCRERAKQTDGIVSLDCHGQSLPQEAGRSHITSDRAGPVANFINECRPSAVHWTQSFERQWDKRIDWYQSGIFVTFLLPAVADESGKLLAAKVSVTVTSHVTHLPDSHGI